MDTREFSDQLTAGRRKIFVKHIWGRFQKLRWISFSFWLATFFVAPFLRWGDRPLILFDLPARQFHLGPLTIWPQEVYLLTFVLMFAAIGLFAFTAVVGRAWCGYVCPQTVVTSVFLEIERRIEGDKPAQERLSKSPWTRDKLQKVFLKQVSWLAVSLAFGFTVVSYFVPNDQLLGSLLTLQAPSAILFWIGFFALATYMDGGYFREQTCLVPCPYGRFQGAMLDKNSLVVGYDPKRGEPRAHFKKDQERLAGDCVDCNLCVYVCPTGIDIRNGLQYECIQCARCVDACDSVMAKVGMPQGLIRYTSQAALEQKKTQIWRPRLAVYSLILVSIASFVAIQLLNAPKAALDIVHNRTMLYRELANNKVGNTYTIKVLNKSKQPQSYMLMVEGLPATIMTGQNPFLVKSGQTFQASATVVVSQESLANHAAITPIRFVLREIGNQSKVVARTRGTFLAPDHLSRHSQKEVGG